MNTLDVETYGYPIRSNYTISTDLALLRTEAQSGWVRQRRTFLHNASIIKLTWRLPSQRAQNLMTWLQAQATTDFFLCDLLSGNDSALNPMHLTEIRRVSTVSADRIPRTDLFLLSFDAETRAQGNYQQLSTDAADQPPTTFPTIFSLPLGSNFKSEHKERNITEYSLTYRFTSESLAEWMAFAGFVGTAWFLHPMVSVNVLCGYELIRYISEPAQVLVSPNVWEVTIIAETKPATMILDEFLPPEPPTGECTYDADIEYDDIDEEYDCGGVTPPQGEFVMPAGQLLIVNNTVGVQPLTATSTLKLNKDGSVECLPGSTPLWTTWHTDAATLPTPVVKLNSVVEISRDNGATWIFYTPGADGPWLDLKLTDIWIRLTKTSTYDVSEFVEFQLNFKSDGIPTPYIDASASVRLEVSLDVTDPTGVVDGASFSDGYIYTIDPGDTVDSVSAGVTFMVDGRVIGQSTNQLLGLWFSPQTPNAGQPLWIILTGAGGGSGPVGSQSFPPTGVRMTMGVNNYFTAIAGAVGGGSAANVFWNGSYQVWNAQSGGTLLGSGTITLESEVSP